MSDTEDEPAAFPLAYERVEAVQIDSNGRTLEIHFPDHREPMRPVVLAGVYAGAGMAVATSVLSYCAFEEGIDPFTLMAAVVWVVAALAVGYFGFQAHRTVTSLVEGFERPRVILLTDRQLVVLSSTAIIARFRREVIDDVYLFFGTSLRIHDKKRDNGVFLNLVGIPPADRSRVRDALRTALRLK